MPRAHNMSVTIRHTSGRVLYVAEDATTLRGAVERAIREGVSLVGADFFRANLAYANLARVNLTDVNFDRANLACANLARADLYGANIPGANLARADLHGANLARVSLARATLAHADLAGAYVADANLEGAYLDSACLEGAFFAGADFEGAYLGDASLGAAYLAGANFANASGVDWRRVEPLHSMLLHEGPHHAYKLVGPDGRASVFGGLTYRVGDTVEAAQADTGPAAGINVATLPWCLRWQEDGERILVVRFGRDDIAAIPHGTDGKLRLHRCEVVEDITDQATRVTPTGAPPSAADQARTEER